MAQVLVRLGRSDNAVGELHQFPLIDQVIHDGKMYLSLDDAVSLALENNLDIAIQRYNLITADVDILRTSSGAVSLGVNTGLVQGTPGGVGSTATTSTVGGGAGGTSIGVGGAGAGAAGIVTSTQGEGAPIDNFDPVLTGTGEEQHQIYPTTNVFAGGTVLNQATTTANLLYTQGFPTGTLMSVGYNNTPHQLEFELQHGQPVHECQLPVPIAPAPAAGVRFQLEPALDPHCAQRPCHHGRRLSEPDHDYGFPD